MTRAELTWLSWVALLSWAESSRSVLASHIRPWAHRYDRVRPWSQDRSECEWRRANPYPPRNKTDSPNRTQRRQTRDNYHLWYIVHKVVIRCPLTYQVSNTRITSYILSIRSTSTSHCICIRKSKERQGEKKKKQQKIPGTTFGPSLFFVLNPFIMLKKILTRHSWLYYFFSPRSTLALPPSCCCCCCCCCIINSCKNKCRVRSHKRDCWSPRKMRKNTR